MRTYLTTVLSALLTLSACGQDATTVDKMNDKAQITDLYETMYRAMIAKDTTTLSRLHADDFTLTHMTGMRQSKREYLNAIAGGTLNYYSAATERLDINVTGDNAVMTGYSRVTADVFGGGRHTWPLRLRFSLRRDNGRWQLTAAYAATY